MICCLAVSPEYRRRGVASILMDEALTNLDRTKEISVSTFRADDEKGTAPRALYEKYGFVADELIEEFDYPNQKYVLHPAGSERKERQLANNILLSIDYIDLSMILRLSGKRSMELSRLGNTREAKRASSRRSQVYGPRQNRSLDFAKLCL